ncbi:MAG: DUF933 domain-containing protein [Fibromonadales bacterium]|nr:DUF933 domain-containing protein [Fibromonadales bacterium]
MQTTVDVFRIFLEFSTAGHLRTEGKDYEVRDGDIMLFLFNS